MIPCRCNRRACQARRNLSKRPEQYARWPVCRVCNEGRMYVDEYRLRRGKRDRAPVCRDSGCTYAADHLARTGKLVPLHRVDTVGCIGREDYVAERAVAASRHSPVAPDHDEGCPF